MKIKEWVIENYERESIEDIVKHGCISGCASGLVTYDETIKFHDEHEEEIWGMLYEDAEGQGLTIMGLIGQFNGQKDVGSMSQFKNLLAWYAVERVCFDIVNEEDEI